MTTTMDELLRYATDRGWTLHHEHSPYDDTLYLVKQVDRTVELKVTFRDPYRVAEAQGRRHDAIGRIQILRVLGGVSAIKKFIREAE